MESRVRGRAARAMTTKARRRPVHQAARCMAEFKTGAPQVLPMLEDGRLVGIVAETHALAALGFGVYADARF